MPEYRVVMVKCRGWWSRTDAGRLEAVLNESAADGWRLTSTTVSPWEGVVVVLERDSPA
ncbi:MAG: DUF4177 domain-containing protein [Candidatus Thermoplasmatota archaeon]